MLNMIESRVLEHTWRQWEPQIIYVHHQSGPFPTRIWLPPFSEPVGIDAPFLMSREVNMIGMAIAKGSRSAARSARRTWARRSTPGIRLRRLRAELQEHRRVLDRDGALPVRDAARVHARGLPAEHARPAAAEPLLEPVAAGWWRLRDAVDYMETASLSVLEFAVEVQGLAAAQSLPGGRDQIALGRRSRRTRTSSAAAARSGRRRRTAAPLAFGGVRVSQLTRRRRRRRDVPAGTWVVPTDQEFAAMAREVLDVQRYPDLRQYPGGPPERPYDAAGWSLPLQMGVASSPASLR
jgi:hypothetical protein